MSARTWFTADLHFGHANVIGLCNRPFDDVRQMDRQLIEVWNATVRPEDEVWVLGDFAYRGKTSAQSYLDQLHGTKHLVAGNHDSEDTRTAPGWASVQSLAETVVEKSRITMCHYGMRTWPGWRKGGLMLFGHAHGRMAGYSTEGGGGTLDVGVDCWGYRPVGLPEILQRIKGLPPMPAIDHDYQGED